MIFRDQPAEGAVALDALKSDTVDLNYHVRGVYVGSIAGGAALKVTMADGSVATFTGLTAGSVLPIRAKRIWSAVTTVSELVGLL